MTQRDQANINFVLPSYKMNSLIYKFIAKDMMYLMYMKWKQYD